MDAPEKATITLNGNTFDFPVVVGNEGDKAIDVSSLRNKTGYTTYDEGLANTGACKSAITYIDGEKGKLAFRGIPIEVVAENSTFIETAYLIIYGELPTRQFSITFAEEIVNVLFCDRNF